MHPNQSGYYRYSPGRLMVLACLVLFFLGKQIGDFYTLASVSLAYFLYFFPNLRKKK